MHNGKMRISLIFGTRPDAIKLCPLIPELKASGRWELDVCVTGQHMEMLAQVLDVFDVRPDTDLAAMEPDQSLPSLTARLIVGIDRYLERAAPDLVIVQGDTTTAFCAALAAFYRKIPVGHVEAGLRTWNKHAPWPEEINRRLLAPIADLHFAPTPGARENLLREGVPPQTVFITGNTVVDSLHHARREIRRRRHLGHCPMKELLPSLWELLQRKRHRLVLITGHRRENFGRGLAQVCKAIKMLAESFPDVQLVYPIHLNPNVHEPVRRVLSGISNVHLIDPLPYLPFVELMDRASFILTDSGGIQEEAPSLGKPVLVMRETTERPEGVDAGLIRLAGTDSESIFREAQLLLSGRSWHDAAKKMENPYGDGKACKRIAAIIAARAGCLKRSTEHPEDVGAVKIPSRCSLTRRTTRESEQGGLE